MKTNLENIQLTYMKFLGIFFTLKTRHLILNAIQVQFLVRETTKQLQQ